MSHSVVKDFPTQTDNTLVLVVNKNGDLSVDKETLDGFAKLGNSQVSIIRVDNDDGTTVDMTVDTFNETDSKMEELSINVENEVLTRNYNSFRMDHCYTPLISPSQQKLPQPSQNSEEDDLELDDLAQTLSILDGNEPTIKDKAQQSSKTMKMGSKLNEKEQQRLQNSDKITLLNKVNKFGVNKIYKGVKTVLKNAKIIKKPEYDSEPEDDDLNDADFEVESPRVKHLKKPFNKRRSKMEHNEINVERNKIVKVRKGVKHIVYKPTLKNTPADSKVEPQPVVPESPTVKSPEIKKIPPKKDKKPLKQIDDGIALFSTPDIIRRVGDKQQQNKDHIGSVPESPTKLKPAKIEDRSKSETSRHSQNSSKNKTPPHRHSLDSNVVAQTQFEKAKVDSGKHSDRRSSIPSDVSSLENSISEAVGNLEDELANPSADMIRSIIHTPVAATPIEPSQSQPIENVTPAVVEHQPQLNLDPAAAALDIDQNILDNINAEELIPEDILYQVAKLVENPDVQNVIDHTLVDGSLSLEATIQTAALAPPVAATTQSIAVASPQQLLPINHQTQPSQQLHQSVANTNNENLSPSKNVPKPIQIVRSDGRIVTLPPIEKPATRSSKKKQESPSTTQTQEMITTQSPAPEAQIIQQQIVQTPIRIQQNIRPVQLENVLPSTSDNLNELPDMEQDDLMSDSDESWNSEDDPDRLWCICKQPHNNRFMICCDTCEDWFHGKCVNVTKAMGQQMEQQGKEWMCPNCVKKTNSGVSSSTPTIINNSTVGKPAKVANDILTKRKSVDVGPSCIVCGNPSRANSVYCSDNCILKHAQGVEKETSKAQKSATPQRIIVFERATGKCLSGPNAPSAANLKQWLREHPGFEVVRPSNKAKQSLVQSKLQVIKNPHGKDGVGLAVNRKGIQVGVLPHSSKQQNAIKLIPATKLNVPGVKSPTVKKVETTSPIIKPKTLQTTLKSPNAAIDKTKMTTPPKPKISRERKQKLLQTPETSKHNAQENIRETVKKTLNEQLLTRLKEVEDIKLTEEEVDKMATEIETQLYKLFGDSGPKYRTKYRSLIFNIKDTKNQTLWRRICEKSISPHQLVRLSPEEMASQELARWRERENKHQLDMIKKSELEMLSINRTYVLKTHKGEQVMEDRPLVKVDSTEIMPGLGADSTSEEAANEKTDKSESSDRSSERKSTSSSKHGRRDKDRDRRSSKDKTRDRSTSKDRKSSSSKNKSKRSRSRDRDKDRSSHRSDRKRSRSRDRHHRSSHKSSRHKRDKHSTEHLDKKSREILSNLENNKIITPPEDRLWKHVPQQDIQVTTPDSDSDHEPTSTVTIPTPPRSMEQEDSQTQTNSGAKKEEVVAAAVDKVSTITDQKVDAIVKGVKTDSRLRRDMSIETPKVESPQPPTTPALSTSPVPTPPAKYTSESKESIIWEGNINMVDVAKFFITLHEVSGDCVGLGSELPSTLEIVGRISPDTVWDYIGKMRRSNSKLISILRLTAGNVEEKMPYIALYSYLSSRTRFGVIKSTNSAVKDFYIMPLASHAPVPQALLPLSGPGFEEARPHLLLGIIVRAKRKRTLDAVPNIVSNLKRAKIENSPTLTSGNISTTTVSRSYTPPPTRDPRIKLPPTSNTLPATNDDDEPYSPEDSDPENTNMPIVTSKKLTAAIKSTSISKTTASILNIKANDLSSVLTAAVKSTSFLDPPATVSSFEPFSNKFEGIPGLDVDGNADSLSIARKIEELNKCIEQEREQIDTMSQNLASSGAAVSMASNLSNISLPSNLQQILDSIKKIPATSASDTGTPEEYCPTAPGYKNSTSAGSSTSDELTIPLILPKLSARIQPPQPPKISESTVFPNLSVPPPVVLTTPPPVTNTTIPLQLPKSNKSKSVVENKPASVLSSLSEEELIRKAAEMLGEAEPNREDSPEPDPPGAEGLDDFPPGPSFKAAPPVMYSSSPSGTVAPPPAKRNKIDESQPPIPGLEDEFDP